MSLFGSTSVGSCIEQRELELSCNGRSAAEEFVNALTHGFGLVLSVVGAVVLLGSALSQGTVWRTVGCSAFGMSLVAVYAASTLSHGVVQPRLRRLFRTLDQGFIYLLIVGTYTPFAVEYLRGGWWWLFFSLMWVGALGGVISKLLFAHRVEGVTIWSYVLLGWLPIFPAPSYLDVVPSGALWWVMIGGLCYTAGTVFLVLDYRRLHFHAIWHLFVIAGSACHYYAVFLFVACAPLQVG